MSSDHHRDQQDLAVALNIHVTNITKGTEATNGERHDSTKQTGIETST
jgi:hypothetical protein